MGYYDGVLVEEVEFCGCTNDELEAGRTCGEPQCPNAPDEEPDLDDGRDWEGEWLSNEEHRIDLATPSEEY